MCRIFRSTLKHERVERGARKVVKDVILDTSYELDQFPL